MLIISVRDNENNRLKTKGKKSKDRKEQRGWAGYRESVRAKWFCYVFKLDFVQLICKAFLIFQSNLELSLSVILKERELYESKHVVVKCTCLKKWKIRALLSFLIVT